MLSGRWRHLLHPMASLSELRMLASNLVGKMYHCQCWNDIIIRGTNKISRFTWVFEFVCCTDIENYMSLRTLELSSLNRSNTMEDAGKILASNSDDTQPLETTLFAWTKLQNSRGRRLSWNRWCITLVYNAKSTCHIPQATQIFKVQASCSEFSILSIDFKFIHSTWT